MGIDYSTLKHKKGEHLNLEERVLIHKLHRQGYSDYKIAKELGMAANTVRNESKRIAGYSGKPWKYYSARKSQDMYDRNRRNCCRYNKIAQCAKFLNYLYDKYNGPEHWSIDSTVGYARKHGLFEKDSIPDTKTVYNWINAGWIKIKRYQLPEATKRHARISEKSHGYKQYLGRNIESRPAYINDRSDFGHWEIDTVIGQKKGKNHVLLTLTERQTRKEIIRKIASKSKECVNEAVEEILSWYKEKQHLIFKTITADNGLEFAGLARFDCKSTRIYFAHPYSSYERGTNERHNRIIRRIIPKGIDINNYSDYEIEAVEDWMNNLPRKILGYDTPEHLFEKELDYIYG